MRLALALLLSCAAVDASALRLGAGPRAEDKLRRFVADDRALRGRLDDAAKREALFRAEARETSLRDAVAGIPPSREELVSALPGMKTPPPAKCASLAACVSPDFAATVDHPELLPDAVRALLRPWLFLQEARGQKTDITPSTQADALLTVTLKGLDVPPLVLNVSPRLLGGFNVWFDEPARLSELYERERAAVFAKN